MITYTLDEPSGITINGAEVKKGGTVTQPRSLVEHLKTRKGWVKAGPKAITKTASTRAKKDS